MIFNLITKAKELFYKNGKTVEGALDELNESLTALDSEAVLGGIDVFTINKNTKIYAGNATNLPEGVNPNGHLEVSYAGEGFKFLRFIPDGHGTRVFTNLCWGGTWQGWEELATNSDLANDTSGKLVGYMATDTFTADKMMNVTSGQIKVTNRNGIVTIVVNGLQCTADAPILGMSAFVGDGFYIYDQAGTGMYIDNSKLYINKSSVDYLVFTFAM